MTKISLTEFRGMAPKLGIKKIEAGMASYACNCRFGSGNLEPWRSNVSVSGLAKSGTIKTLWRYKQGDDDLWFHWDHDVTCVNTPTAGDEWGLVFFCSNEEEFVPRLTESAIAGSTGAENPTDYYTLGVPAPGDAPSVSAPDLSGCDDEVDQTTTYYAQTLVDAYGFEGPPSVVSSEVTFCAASPSIDIDLVDAPSGSYNLASKRLYRSVTDSGGNGSWMLVATVDLSITTYTDTSADDELSTELASTYWYAPETDLKGFTVLPNGIIAGFRDNEIWLSEAYLPHAWPEEYMLSVDYDVVGLSNLGSTLVILTEGVPYLASGTEPSDYSLSKLNAPQACSSRRGIVQVAGESILYPSPDGLVEISTEYMPALYTKGTIDKQFWQDLDPTSIHGYYYDDKYVGFYDNGDEQGGFIIDPSDDDAPFSWLDFHATAGYTDIEDDSLYLVIGGSVYQFDAGESYMTATWHSGALVVPKRMNAGVAQIIADKQDSQDSLDETFYLQADGVLKHTQTLSSDESFVMPGGYLGRKFVLKLMGTATVSEAYLAKNNAYLMSDEDDDDKD